MCDKNPFVSLIIPVYNATDSIKGLISDILKRKRSIGGTLVDLPIFLDN